jgi:type IV pilus assembly protein PilB
LRRRIGETLIAQGVITESSLQVARFEQKRSGGRLGDTLVRLCLATESQVTNALAEQNNIPLWDFVVQPCDPNVVKLIPKQFAKKHRCIACEVKDKELMVVMSDPLSLSVIQDLEFATGCRVKLSLATTSQIIAAIEKYYSETALATVKEPSPQEVANRTNSELPDILAPESPEQGYFEEASESKESAPETVGPIADLVDNIMEEALASNASDIHIEGCENGVRVRHRLDGLLKEVTMLPKWAQDGLITRLKVMASLDIAERRLPQDGRLRIQSKEGRNVDFRMSTLKTVHGEKIVLRILDHSKGIPPLESLGFSANNLKQFQQFLKHRHGMILTVGPTGSGKSTTLASAVASIRSAEINIVTIEDPVEYQITGVNQTQIHEKIKLTFASSLRSILRQDPDVILVGEIRDHETAQIAMQAAQTGHLVLSTLHTEDAPSSVTRLCDMGIEPYIIGSSLVGVVAQRLVRKLCQHCRAPYSPPPDVLLALNITRHDLAWPMYNATGCPECRQTGYRGRIGIYEIMNISSRIARLISQHADESAIRDAALEEGMTTLGEDGLEKVKAGLTSPEELLRVVTEVQELRTLCPGCGASTGIDFAACPECGRRLGGGCPKCGRSIKASWHFCPFCTTRVSPAQSAAGQTVRASNVEDFREATAS